MIRAVIFDVGGVLYGSSYGSYFHRIARVLHENYLIDTRESLLFMLSRENQLMTGKMRLDNIIAAISKRFSKKIMKKDIVNVLNERPNHLDKKMLLLSKDLRRRYKVFVISDDFKEAAIPMKRKIKPYFDRIYFSCDYGTRKPSSRFFKLALKDIKVSPEECIFIDDKPENVRASRKLRMKGIRFLSYNKLVRDLRRAGVLK